MRIQHTITLLAAAATFASEAQAAPLDRRIVPAEAKFVLSLDVDAARDTALGRAINEKLEAVPDFKTKIAQVSVVTGMSYPQDLHDVTLYARVPGDDAVVVVAHAHMDRQRMLTAVSTTPDHATRHVGGYDVIRWTDAGKTMFGAFHDDGTLVVARSEANVTTALDTIDGRAPAMAADGPLSGSTPATTRPAVGPGEHPMAFVALADLPGLANDRVDVPGPLKQVEGGCLSVLEQGGSIVLRANVTATSTDGAEQLRAAAEGVRAMLGFAAAGPDATAESKRAAALLSQARLGRADRTVTFDAVVPAETVRASLDKARFGPGADDADGKTPAASKAE